MVTKAVFLDRDGVINELVYYEEHGIIDSPVIAEQFRLLPSVCEAIRKLNEMDYKVVLVSNQPAIAKGKMSEEAFTEIRQKMTRELAAGGASLDGEYYCFHHPEAKLERMKIDCECRKPKPGLLIQAAKDMDIALSQSWMIGDGLTDIKAGNEAGARTILLSKMKCELCHRADKKDSKPDVIAPDLIEAVQYIIGEGG